jgi:LuxR family maltose regulon positive regulatory protein
VEKGSHVNKPLLSTKLFIPTSPLHVISRPDLVDIIERNLVQKLTLVSAPAGFGKSTLVCEWAKSHKGPTSWITLDKSDNDPSRFISYLYEALKLSNIKINKEQINSFVSPEVIEIDAISTLFLNSLAHSKEKIVLVLDDYHLIDNPNIHQLITYFLNHSPPTFHTIISTRADPPLPLSRMRARGEMIEVRVSDLRFKKENVEKFFKKTQDHVLSDSDIQKLLDRTEGWIAGLQMASIALKNRENFQQFIQSFSGSHDYIADYLSDEVLRNQTNEVHDFLICTSILSLLSAPLCDFVTGKGNSQKFLKYLKESNIFLHSLDGESKWFRYHHLFSDLLRKRLYERKSAEDISHLYKNASIWFEEEGLYHQAIEYSTRGGAFERAANIIEKVAEDTIARSEVSTYKHWMTLIPENLIRKHPLLAIYYAWTLLIGADNIDHANSILVDLPLEDEHTIFQINSVKSTAALFSKDIPSAIELARHALEYLPEEDYFFRNVAAWNLSAALCIKGEVEEGLQILYEVIRMGKESGNILVAAAALSRLGSAKLHHGNLFKSKELFEEALDIAKDSKGATLPIACDALIGIGRIYLEWGELDNASRHIEEGIDLYPSWKRAMEIEAFGALAYIYQVQGQESLAIKTLEKAIKLASQTDITQSDDRYVAAQQADLWLRQGKIHLAKQWALEQQLENYIHKSPDEIQNLIAGIDSSRILLSYDLIIFTKLLLAEKRITEAQSILEYLLSTSHQSIGLRKQIEIHLLQAIVNHKLRKEDKALSSLRIAVQLGNTGRFIQIFIENGLPILELLKNLYQQDFENEYVAQIIRSFPPQSQHALKDSQTEIFIEQLSNREIDVLHLLPTELTVPEIAQHLGIAPSTVRSHVKNIYGKLGVHSRFEAVTVAKKSGML